MIFIFCWAMLKGIPCISAFPVLLHHFVKHLMIFPKIQKKNEKSFTVPFLNSMALHLNRTMIRFCTSEVGNSCVNSISKYPIQSFKNTFILNSSFSPRIFAASEFYFS